MGVVLREDGGSLDARREVRPLLNARVLWTIERWFASQRLAIARDADLRGRDEEWLLEKFAVGAGNGSETSQIERRTVFADRIGDSHGISPHGGRGRVATIGHFQVKGIGPTQLVGDATWMHSHGHMSLTEAVAEAIFGELLDQELPFGAVPVIAIIDTGESCRVPDVDVPRALIVRPAVFRPAHLMSNTTRPRGRYGTVRRISRRLLSPT
jgi:hypothetical protein